MTEPKMFTKEDALVFLNSMTRDEQRVELQERGLIAADAVDPLLIEAREIVIANLRPDELDDGVSERGCRSGMWDRGFRVEIALAALRRGMELQREKLTREMVREVVKSAMLPCRYAIDQSDFEADAHSRDKRNLSAFLDRLHAALLERLP